MTSVFFFFFRSTPDLLFILFFRFNLERWLSLWYENRKKKNTSLHSCRAAYNIIRRMSHLIPFTRRWRCLGRLLCKQLFSLQPLYGGGQLLAAAAAAVAAGRIYRTTVRGFGGWCARDRPASTCRAERRCTHGSSLFTHIILWFISFRKVSFFKWLGVRLSYGND